MALFRLLWWWRDQHPISHRDALVLRNLLAIQTLVVLMTLLSAAVLFYTKSPRMGIYVLGFGTGFIVAIRYYVWRYVG
jgi:hypothetical protein